MDKDLFNRIYEKPDQAPWTDASIYEEFKELFVSKKVLPCPTLEVGCGEGYYSIYLASQGFRVTAIDWSINAIKNAQENAKKASVSVDFFVGPWQIIEQIEDCFDFVFDWRFLHDLLDEQERKKYIEKISEKVKPGGYYLSFSFSDKTTTFNETGKIRLTSVGNRCYFASQKEFEELMSPFKIISKKEIIIPREKDRESIYNLFLMRK